MITSDLDADAPLSERLSNSKVPESPPRASTAGGAQAVEYKLSVPGYEPVALRAMLGDRYPVVEFQLERSDEQRK